MRGECRRPARALGMYRKEENNSRAPAQFGQTSIFDDDDGLYIFERALTCC